MPEGKKVPTAKIGNATRDPELRYSDSGVAYAKFGLAWKPYTGKGQPEAETVFYEVTCFGDFAENVVGSVHKGDRVLVIGEGEQETWTGRDGQERITNKITANGCGPDLRFATAVISRAESSQRAPF